MLDLKSFLRYDYKNDCSALPFTSYYLHGGASKFKPLQLCVDEQLNSQFSNRIYNDMLSVINLKLDNDVIYKNRSFGQTAFKSTLNIKLKALKVAQSVGFNIPETRIIDSKIGLQEALNDFGSIITKSITNGAEFGNEKISINGERTELITDELVKIVGEQFFPTLIQQNVSKEFEIRVFYFRGHFRCIAIFSYDEKTNLDYRNVNPNIPNREIPFELPIEIKKMVVELMHSLKLNYGCIDLIMGKDDNYYFLEVNEFGQYGFVSKSGNFYLEELIAKFLSNGSDKNS